MIECRIVTKHLNNNCARCTHERPAAHRQKIMRRCASGTTGNSADAPDAPA